MSVVEALLTLAPHIAKLVEAMTKDDYDQDAELQTMLAMNRAIADARAAKALG